MDKNTLDEKLIININGQTDLAATLYDNSSSRALVELLQKGAVTVKMHDYGSFEKVGPLGTSLPRTDTQITTEPGKPDYNLLRHKQLEFYPPGENHRSFKSRA